MPWSNNHTNEGMAIHGPEPTMKDEEIVAFVRDSGRPFATASEVAKEGEMSRQNAYRRLSRLEREGAIEKYKVGSSAVIWWVGD